MVINFEGLEMKKRINGKGSLTIEAAIFLPIFIISVFTIAFIMKLFCVQECLQHAISDEIVRKASESYLEYKAGENELPKILREFNVYNEKNNFSENIEKHFSQNTIKTMHILDGPKIIEYRYFFNGRFENSSINEPYQINTDYLIEAVSMSKIRMPFSIRFVSDMTLAQRVIARGWVGTEKISNPMNFNEMAKEKKEKIVYIFPRAGERYHKKSCLLISNYPTLKILTDTIKNQYRPCKLCDARRIDIGTSVFIFEDSGEVYHAGNCVLVDKYVVPMDIKEAEDQGYTPCKRCYPSN